MSVLSCDREGCTGIMCDRLSAQYGYICWECFQDLLDNGPCDIGEWMKRPREQIVAQQAWPELIDEEFPSR